MKTATQTPERNKAVLHFGGSDVTIIAKLAGTTNTFSKGMKNHVFNITVSFPSGNWETFKFHTSANDYNKGKNWMDEQDLKEAMDCIFRDATAGKMDFEEFCGEFGYDEDSRKAYGIYEECGILLDKVENLFTDAERAYDEFRKAYPEL